MIYIRVWVDGGDEDHKIPGHVEMSLHNHEAKAANILVEILKASPLVRAIEHDTPTVTRTQRWERGQ